MPKSDKKTDKKSGSDKKGIVKKANSPAKSKPVLAVPASSREILAKAAKLADASSDSSSDEEPTKSSAPALAKKASVKKAPMSDSSSSDSSSDEEPTKSSAPTLAKKASAKKPPMPDSSSSDSSSDEEPTKSSAPTLAKKVLATKAPISDSSSSDSSSDEEPAKSSAIPPSKKVSAKKASTSDSSSSDSSSDEEPTKSSMATPAKKKIVKGPSMSDSSNSSGDDDEDEDKNEDVDMAETAPTNAINKRKADSEAVAPQKKVKLANGDSTTVTSGEEIKSIFVGKLSWNVDNDWLAQEFAECGEVESARVQMDRNTGRSRGFGHVHFKSADAVEKALAMNGKEIDGRAVNIDKSNPPDKKVASEKRAQAFGDAPSSPSAVLFVGNLSFGVNEDTLWETFGEHGDVKSVRVPTDRESGRPKGFAYVEFSDIEAAQKAHAALHGFELDGRSLRLDFSQPRDDAGGRGGGQSGRGGRGRGGFGGDRGGFGGGGRGGSRGGGRGGSRGGRGGDRGGRGGRGRGGARTGGITQFEGQKIRFD